MEIPVSARTRSLLVRYEANKPAPDDASLADLPPQAVRESLAQVQLQPFGAIVENRPRDPQSWDQAFYANDRFADQLLMKEAQFGLELPVHLFGRAPLALMLHLGHRLKRRPLAIYQEQVQPAGTWAVGFDSAVP